MPPTGEFQAMVQQLQGQKLTVGVISMGIMAETKRETEHGESVGVNPAGRGRNPGEPVQAQRKQETKRDRYSN